MKVTVKDAAFELPPGLVQAVQNKRVVMFLGAGASMEARGPNNTRPPSGAALRESLARTFFNDPMNSHDLMSVADMAISIHGQSIVFEHIRKLIDPFLPSQAHLLLPRFHWRMLATTNYDLLVERAYASAPNSVQSVVPFIKNSEPVEEKEQTKERPVVLLKLHGCLDHMHDPTVPLILSHEHYALHRKHRSRLFDRLIEKAYESTFIFCGYSLGDAHIRKILHDLQNEDVKRPMWYIVTPQALDQEVIYWAASNVHVIRGTFGNFMNALNGAIPEMWRSLEPGAGIVELPIQTHFRTRADPSPALRIALGKDWRHVHAAMPVLPQDPGKFYEGYDTGWGAVVNGLDVKRRVVDDLLLETVSDDGPQVRFHLLRGPAGSGKTVALKRAAWNAAIDLDQVVLWLEDGGILSPDLLAELHSLTGKRLVLFVDRAAERWPNISALLTLARKKGMQVSLIAAERDNEWNVYGGRPGEGVVPSELRIGQLSTPEVEQLVDLLATHGSLGVLTDAPREKQVEALGPKAERQLLVALHEATRGVPFEEIILDEYDNIVPERARRLYLDICTLNQFGAPVRAGTISRASGVRFDHFREELLAPLENVVLVEEEPRSGDMAYRSRHPKVAELVFQQACPDDTSKAERLIRLVEQLDIGYSVDRRTMEQVARGRSLAVLIPTAALGREVYQAMLRAEPDQAHIYQQWAIYEMQVPDGSFEEAEKLAAKAASLSPTNYSIAHTWAEVARRRLKDEHAPVCRDRYLQQARQRLANAGNSTDRMVVSTRCKLLVDEVIFLVRQIGDNPTASQSLELAEKVREAQAVLRQSQQLYADDADMLQTEANLHQALDQGPKAVIALEKAWHASPRGSAIALRLSRAYVARGEPARAVDILKEALEKNPDDKTVHLELARRALDTDQPLPQVTHHLERSYARGDANFDARHLHAQVLFLSGSAADSLRLFKDVDHAAPLTFLSGGLVLDKLVSKRLPRYRGRITRKEATFSMLSAAIFPGHIHVPQRYSDPEQWKLIDTGSDVDFVIQFNRRGPVALDVRQAKQP